VGAVRIPGPVARARRPVGGFLNRDRVGSAVWQNERGRLRRALTSDVGVYVGSGLFAIVVFTAAVWLMTFRGFIDPTDGTLLTLSAGFLLFLTAYFVSLVWWHVLGE